MAIDKSILGKDGFERTYHRIPSFTIILENDGTCLMKINTQNWKDKESRVNNSQSLDLQHCIIGLPPGVMKIAYEMIKKYFPEYNDGNDVMEDSWKEEKKPVEIKAVSQTTHGKLLESRTIKED